MSPDIKLKHKEFFNIPKKTFAVVGIDPLAENDNDIIKHPFICCGYYLLTFIFVLACIDFSVVNLDSMNEHTTISVLNQLILVLWKIAVFWIKRQRICKLIKDIWRWNEEGESGILNTQLSQLLQNSSSLERGIILQIFEIVIYSLKGDWMYIKSEEIHLLTGLEH
ncbi:hypothetical protein FF38_03228 [Lucilia cuprina]|uniref:Uncharacterized protein n=1 Tax=Lucilia cuprina TaxID=7375 RepID=A0A0L0BP83_LUCCU|nr:hypothetical protein FF38_03228 [Lucilia cuprina]